MGGRFGKLRTNKDGLVWAPRIGRPPKPAKATKYSVRYWYGRDHINDEQIVSVPPGRTLSGVLRELGINHVYSVKPR